MNRIETLKIVGTLRESYPNGAEVTENTIDLWTALLEPYEYEKVWQATLEICKEWDGYTMPPPAAIIKKLDNVPSERKAKLRREADKLLCRGSTLTQDDFREASPEIQKHFGSVARLRKISQMPAEQADRELDRFERELPNITKEIKQLGAGQLLIGNGEQEKQ